MWPKYKNKRAILRHPLTTQEFHSFWHHLHRDSARFHGKRAQWLNISLSLAPQESGLAAPYALINNLNSKVSLTLQVHRFSGMAWRMSETCLTMAYHSSVDYNKNVQMEEVWGKKVVLSCSLLLIFSPFLHKFWALVLVLCSLPFLGIFDELIDHWSLYLILSNPPLFRSEGRTIKSNPPIMVDSPGF